MLGVGVTGHRPGRLRLLALFVVWCGNVADQSNADWVVGGYGEARLTLRSRSIQDRAAHT